MHLCTQGGEDGFYTDEKICQIVSKIKAEYPDCAVTLSIGEKSRESYQAYFDAGADRYLLRHETADEAHYEKLHPVEMSHQNRMRCLRDLKRNRISDRMRIYGRFALSDRRYPVGRSAVYP